MKTHNKIVKPNNTIKIDKAVPMPDRYNGVGIASVLKRLQVGDSFLYHKDQRTQFSGYGKRLGIKLASRSVPEEPNKVRVWRTK